MHAGVAATAVTVLLVVIVSPALAATVAETEQLISFFNATNGARWFVKDGWVLNRTNATSDACQWFGVFCNAARRVTEVSLRRNNVRGPASALSLDALQFVAIVDLSFNGLQGAVPDSLFRLPRLTQLQLHGNRLDKFPTAVARNATANWTELTLAGNPYFCPLPVIPQGVWWTDQNDTACLRTATDTVEVSPTVVVEPPVPTLGSVLNVHGLLIETGLSLDSPNTTLLFVTVFVNVLRAEEIETAGRNATDFFAIGFQRYGAETLVHVNFTAAVPMAVRNSFVARLRSGHTSVRLLLVERVVVVEDAVLPTAPTTASPPPPPVDVGAVDRQNTIIIIVVGVVAAVLFFAAIGVAWCLRRRVAFQEVEAAPGWQPPLHKSQSLRMQPTAAASSASMRRQTMRGQSMRGPRENNT